MATTKRVTIGHVECPTCKAEGRTRRARVATNVRGSLFYACDGDDEYGGCGINHMGYRGGQAWMKKNTKFLPGFEHMNEDVKHEKPVAVVEEKKIIKLVSEKKSVDKITPTEEVKPVIKKLGFWEREIF